MRADLLFKKTKTKTKKTLHEIIGMCQERGGSETIRGTLRICVSASVICSCLWDILMRCSSVCLTFWLGGSDNIQSTRDGPYCMNSCYPLTGIPSPCNNNKPRLPLKRKIVTCQRVHSFSPKPRGLYCTSSLRFATGAIQHLGSTHSHQTPLDQQES